MESTLNQSHKHKDLRVIHKRSGEETYGRYWLALIHRRDLTTNNIILNPNIGRVIGSFLDTGIGGTKANFIGGQRVTKNKRAE